MMTIVFHPYTHIHRYNIYAGCGIPDTIDLGAIRILHTVRQFRKQTINIIKLAARCSGDKYDLYYKILDNPPPPVHRLPRLLNALRARSCN